MKEEELLDNISQGLVSDENDLEDDNKNRRTVKNKLKKAKELDIFLFDRNPNSVQGESFDDSLQREANLNKTIEDIYYDNNKFNHVNPMRVSKYDAKYKRPQYQMHSKEVAVKEVITNLKTQYILFNIRKFVRNFEILTNPNINHKSYKISLNIRNMSLYIYGIIMLFERPWFCYEGTTIPLPSTFKFIENCEKDVVFNNVPFIYNNVLRGIEILFTLSIGITQIIKYKVECSLKETNTGVNTFYNIIQVFLFISLFLCLVDLIISICLTKFPVINFICRPFIYIYMIKRLRMNWINILKVLWATKKAYFALFINIIVFSLIGYILFKKEGGFFESFGESVLQLYILLSTCNFPDIMFEAMEYTKFAIIYFVICLSINYFILLSYLNNLYTSKYYKVNKKDCLLIIKDVIENPHNKHIFQVQKFTRFLLKQKYIYNLNNDEYNNLLVLLNLYNRNSDLYNRLVKVEESTLEFQMVKNTKYGKYILESIWFEGIINILYIICTFSIFINFKQTYFLIFHYISSFLITYEPFLCSINRGIKRFFKKHIYRTLFHLFNLLVLICLIYLSFLDQNNTEQKATYDYVFNALKIFISLRTIRIFVFLDKFRIIKNIYIIIRISKEMLNRNFLTLYSFILFFSTLSILLTGGNIKKDSFINESNIPNDYKYINFNDFASSYISCFCLLMINNLNILVKSLTFETEHKMFFEFYFATFYFFSTLILINIIQTLLLEMYLISDQSLSDNQLNDKNKQKEQRESEATLDKLVSDYDDDEDDNNDNLSDD